MVAGSISSLTPISKRLEGIVAVITGGASGVGECTARLFVKHGAKVIIADVQDNLGKSICEEINSHDQVISYIHCDVTNESDVENAVDTAISKHGKLDIMFSNAGILGPEDSSITNGVDYDMFKRVFDVNVYGAILCAKHAARVMIPAKKGTILFTSSASSVTYGISSHTYTASKNALVGLAKNLCVELGEYGIRVNCISPSGMATRMTLTSGVATTYMVEAYMSYIGNLKEAILKADDVAEAAVFLGSDESKNISGVNLVVDGGYSTTNVAIKDGLKSFAFFLICIKSLFLFIWSFLKSRVRIHTKQD